MPDVRVAGAVDERGFVRRVLADPGNHLRDAPDVDR